MNLISIIMPCYNSEKTLKKSINSLLAQNCNNWELIAVDDGSTDFSWQILNECASIDSRIKVFRQENSGPGMARNFAISNANGEYVAFLDSDDWWENDFIERINKKIISEDPDVIFYDLVREKEDGTVIGTSCISNYKNLHKEDLIRYQMTGKMEWGMVKVIKRSIIVDNQLFFSTDSVGEEAIFSYLVLKNSKKLAFIDKPIYHYVLFDNGQHKKGELDPWWNMVCKMKDKLTEENSIDIYEATVNSLALRALCIACYRIAIGYPCRNAKKQIKDKIDEYFDLYDLNKIERDALDKGTLMLLPFIKAKLIVPIIIASKIRSKRR